MKYCILSDFDGTITKKDGLYSFISEYAQGNWEYIEQIWAEGKISSKECLVEEFKLVPNLSEELILKFIKTIEIDESFSNFYDEVIKNKIDFYIVSDGIDYFIERILKKYNLKNIKIISNHGEFKNNSFEITFPNDYKGCKNNAGTCKCKILSNLKNKYEKIIYVGDGVSDYCVADKADILYAKSRLLTYCQAQNIPCKSFETFKDLNIIFKNI